MPDVGLYDVVGVRPERPNKYNPIATYSWIGGLQTQRSPFVAVDTRYNKRMLGGKPDALLSGSNCEINNSLTLQRRPGLAAYGPSIPAPDFYFNWEQAQTANFLSVVDPGYVIYPQGNLQLLIDTPTNGTTAPGSVYNYSPTYAGILFNKAVLSGQTSMDTVGSTVYFGNGVDLYKQPGANLLTQSNSFGTTPWSHASVTFVTGDTDPTGGTNATRAAISGTASGIQQAVAVNYTPVGSNTFTFSIWLKSLSGNTSAQLTIEDQASNVVIQTNFTITTSWVLYQVTGTALSSATSLLVLISTNTNTVGSWDIYGAQLEVGGPATGTVITTTKPLGMYLWGITAPTSAPSFTTTVQTGSTGQGWQANHLYSQTTYAITTVAASGPITPVTTGGVTYSTAAVYTGTVSVTANSLIGRYFSITGAAAANNNTIQDTSHPGTAAPGFVCVGNNGSTTLLLANLGATVATAQTITATLLDTIIDSNGNLEVAYIPGKSGGAAPIWNPVAGNTTLDGLQNFIVQANTVPSPGVASGGGSLAFNVNVTAGSTLVVFMLQLSGTSSGVPTDGGDTFVLSKSNVQSGRNLALYMYHCLSAGGGATTITWTGTGSVSWVGIAEIATQSSIEANTGSNFAKDTLSSNFLTGSITPTHATTSQTDVIFTWAAFVNGSAGFEIGNTPVLPIAFQSIVNLTPNVSNGKGQYWNMGAALSFVNAPTAINPNWFITNPDSGFNDSIGLTTVFESSVGSLVWWNLGQTPTTGLTPKVGYTYLYAFVNTYTGHRSNVSLLSTSTGAQTGVDFNVSGVGAAILTSGTGAGVANVNPTKTGTGDPQVDAIELYRNQDGGGFWYQVPPALLTNATLITGADGNQYIKNPGTQTSQGIWTVTDGVLDSQLNTQISAPVGLLNSVPPQGLTDLEFFDGRLWGSVGATLYYATGADDASLINVTLNGVSAESWEPTNTIPFNSPIIRIVATGAGLIVFTSTDVWGVSGTNLATYSPTRLLTGIGLGTYNGICIDGSTIMMYTRDRQSLIFNVNMGCSEIGFLIGDLIEADINPQFCYLARHVKGSQDNAFYFGDGQTGWFRMNPNNYGASQQGEQTPIWSPFATVASSGGAGAMNSVEVQPGVKLLLVGAAYINAGTGAYTTGTFPILNRDITIFKDNGTSYSWNAVMGSLLLALPGKLAEIESITTEMRASVSKQVSIGVLINEISGTFEDITSLGNNPSNDPTQLPISVSVISNRFYLSPGTVPPLGRHMQIKLTSNEAADSAGTKDEMLAITVRGALIEEQQ